ncbi:MAG: type-F conjugative transfer system secretin TraK, partial [Desulfobaccales bacterium]
MPRRKAKSLKHPSLAISLLLVLVLILGVAGVAWGQENPSEEREVKTQIPDLQGQAGENLGAVRDEIMAALNKVNTGSKKRSRSSGVGVHESPVVKVEPGRNLTLTVAGDQLNRIVTPFSNPLVHSVSKAKINVDGSVVYISIAQDDGPTTMFITENGESDPSISLTLVPQNITPREIRLSLAGGSVGSVTAVSSNGKAAKWEKNQPYTEAIEKVMLATARGEVPQGYSFHNPVPPEVPLPRCGMAVRIEPRQVMEGHNFLMVVSKLTNISSGTLMVDESSCYQEGVRAVAVWPNVKLNPRQSTELYVVYQRGAGQKPSRRP